ncbi:MAG TPA: KpsF/GutQ family sugar-phosphate isomerase [Acidobacteriota bacterium]
MSTIEDAREVIEIEARIIHSLIERIGPEFEAAVEMLLDCRGRVIVTGIGKSGLIGKKIAATLSSTGTPAIYLHAGEARHGDIGIVTPEDLVLVVSYSGGSEEVLSLLPFFKRFGVRLIAITGKPDSTLGRAADACLDVSVEKEACPLNLAPTASTTASLVMGDALAMALLKRRRLSPEEFAIFHPAGALGKRLLLKVEDLMHSGDENPVVDDQLRLREAIVVMSSKRLGLVAVRGPEGRLAGILTDGDLRRILQHHPEGVLELRVSEVMTRSPKTIKKSALAMEALREMETHAITSLLIVDPEGRPEATIHLHDILKAGLV